MEHVPVHPHVRGADRFSSAYGRSRDMAVAEFDGAAGAGGILQNVQGQVRPGASETGGERE